MSEPTLTDIDRRLQRIENGLFGNGREGVIRLSARMEERISDTEERLDTIEHTRTKFTDRIYSMILTLGMIVYGFWDQR